MLWLEHCLTKIAEGNDEHFVHNFDSQYFCSMRMEKDEKF